MKSEKPVFENRIIATDQFKIDYVVNSVNELSFQVNANLLPLLQKAGITLNTDLFHEIMINPNRIRSVYMERVESELQKLGISGEILKESMIQASQPVISELEKAVTVLHSYENQLSHSVFMTVGTGITLFQKIKIVSDKAMISAEAVRDVTAMFTSTISTPQQETAYLTLQAIADGMTAIRTMLSNSIQIVPELIPDREFFDMDENGKVGVSPNAIRYF